LIDVNTGHIPLGVLHDCTHTGLSVGEDGETHQERNYNNLPFDHTQVWVVGDSNQAAAMAERGLQIIAEGSSSIYVFSSRSNHPQVLTKKGEPLYGSNYVFDGKATVVAGHDTIRDEATILSYGAPLHEAIKAAEILAANNRTVRVLNVACIRPLDASAVMKAALETQHLIVVEDHNTEGGLASQVADLIADLALPCTLRRIGVRHYYPSAPSEQLTVLAGMDSEEIANVVEDQFAYRLAGGEETFVAFMYALSERLKHTRFSVTAMPFIETLRSNLSYVEELRALWKVRTLEHTALPSTKDLLEKLPLVDAALGLHALTGTDIDVQHDNGII